MRFKPVFYTCLTLAALGLGLFVETLEPARRVDAWTSDLWHVLAGKRREPSRVAVALLDDEALAAEPDRPLVFWGPLYAKVLAVLRQAGVAAVGIDIQPALSPVTWMDLIGADSSRDFDRQFMLELATGKTVLAASVSTESGEPVFSLPATDYLLALPGHEADLGLTNVPLDRDGVVRRFAPALFAEGEPRLSFAAALARKADPAAPGLANIDAASALSPRPIPFLGPPGSFSHLSFARLLAPDALQDPAVQALAGKVVILGIDIHGAHDRLASPYSLPLFGAPKEFMAGPEIHANIVEALLAGRGLAPLGKPVAALAWLPFLVLAALACARLHPGPSALAAVGCLLASFCLGYGLFLAGKLLPLAGCGLGIGCIWAGANAVRLSRGEREKAHIRQAFGKYVSEAAIAGILESGQPPAPGGSLATVTILFSDIRNFTTLSEKLSAQEVVELLNAYFSKVCDIILAHGGMIDKFIGDAVMAVFGAPLADPAHARQALSTALGMVVAAKDFQGWMRQRFPKLGDWEFRIGVGLHAGPAVVGNIGSKQRLDFTVIGDTVNTASRLEGFTKVMGCPVVASQAVVDLAGAGVVTGKSEPAQVKGKRDPVPALEILAVNDQ
ncbi:adenylate/guanylate cyclase domain-containing protein [Solidesulfovibrio sp.]|nr:adenylate/guanylate cyclase domain-containing protein [Solidesulfovibrio sp.]